MNDLVLNYYESLRKIKKLQVMDAKEIIVSDSARVFRQEIIDIKLSMQYPLKTDQLKVTNCKIPTLLNLFLADALSFKS